MERLTYDPLLQMEKSIEAELWKYEEMKSAPALTQVETKTLQRLMRWALNGLRNTRLNREAVAHTGDYCYPLLGSQGWIPQGMSAEEIAEKLIQCYLDNLEMQRKELEEM
jgi:hypothetical protein